MIFCYRPIDPKANWKLVVIGNTHVAFLYGLVGLFQTATINFVILMHQYVTQRFFLQTTRKHAYMYEP